MRNNVDLSPFRRSTVGFDRLFDMLESGLPGATADSYPPFDLVRESDDRHRINLAVAGFRPDEIDVVVQQNQLLVTGRKPENDNTQYIHRGIATRNFERRFALADYVQVKSANLTDGLLERFSTVLNRWGIPAGRDFWFRIRAGEGGRHGWANLYRSICVGGFWQRLKTG